MTEPDWKFEACIARSALQAALHLKTSADFREYDRLIEAARKEISK
jgi:hypothetical protein